MELEAPDGKGSRSQINDIKIKAPQTVAVVDAAGAHAPGEKGKGRRETIRDGQTQLLPATMSDFQGEVIERTGVEGLEAIDDITMVVVPDLMTTMPGQKLDLAQVKAVLGIPEDVDTYALVPLGYPRDNFGPVRRKPVEEVSFLDRWGQPLA